MDWIAEVSWSRSEADDLESPHAVERLLSVLETQHPWFVRRTNDRYGICLYVEAERPSQADLVATRLVREALEKCGLSWPAVHRTICDIVYTPLDERV